MTATDLYPQPTRLRRNTGVADLRGVVTLVVPSDLYAPLRSPLLRLQEALDAIPGVRANISATAPSGTYTYSISLKIDKRIGNEQAYDLRIAQSGSTLAAQTPQGLFYGLQTFAQLVGNLPQGQQALPCLRIQDSPDIDCRGIMLDVSRCKVPTLDTLKSLIDQFARLKINQLQLYTEHTFAFEHHQQVWKNASPLTPGDILELDTFCKERFVELVPNFNSFGHFERWLRHAQYKKYANSPDGYTNLWGTAFPHGSLLKPDKDTLELLDSLYDELLPHFSSRQFNVGCDETFELGTDWSKTLCERRGTNQVYLDFLKQINRLCKKHDKTMMFWGDIIMKEPQLIPELPANIMALEWGYEADHPFAADCKKFAQSGIPFYVCPGTSSWNSLTGRTSNAEGNLRSAAKNGKKQSATGFLNTDWGDNGHHQYLPISYLPFTIGACYSWNTRQTGSCEDGANRIFFGDISSAGLFAELGRSHEGITTPFFNSTVFHHLLFHGKVPHEKLVGLSSKELQTAQTKLTDLRSAQTQIKDSLIRREYRNAIDMALLGIHRGLLLTNSRSRNTSLPRIKKEHRALWLARNRSGGLRESLSRFR